MKRRGIYIYIHTQMCIYVHWLLMLLCQCQNIFGMVLVMYTMINWADIERNNKLKLATFHFSIFVKNRISYTLHPCPIIEIPHWTLHLELCRSTLALSVICPFHPSHAQLSDQIKLYDLNWTRKRQKLRRIQDSNFESIKWCVIIIKKNYQ